MELQRPLTFAGGADRAAQRRRDAAWLEAARRAAGTRVFGVRSTAQLLVADGPRLGQVAADNVAPEDEITFLGLDKEGNALFALDLGSDPPEASSLEQTFEELRALGSLLPPEEAGFAAHAVAMVGWHRRHRFCGVCGAATLVTEAGHSRRCDGCGAQHFPRTDPAVIMLVTDGPRCVLGKRGGRLNFWTVLAGFVEPGESLEEAVAREVQEEVGLTVTSTRYLASQPWPFPANIMVGFEAHAPYADLVVDEELEDARWFDRDQLREALANGEVNIPPPVSIAYHLIQAWLAEA
ncbi:MAG: NAD(+) diphosphatase [Chloroflexi bacterium]|nr:NAD(+) diphosphatase [Chloroflexota bacterium]